MRRHTFIVFFPSAGINIVGSGALRLSVTSVTSVKRLELAKSLEWLELAKSLERLELAKSLERLDFFLRILIPIVRNTPLI
jgi:hypothetical protein